MKIVDPKEVREEEKRNKNRMDTQKTYSNMVDLKQNHVTCKWANTQLKDINYQLG